MRTGWGHVFVLVGFVGACGGSVDEGVASTDGDASSPQTCQMGGGTVTTLATGLSAPTDLAVQGGYVYWTNNGEESVTRMLVNGGAIAMLASGLGNIDRILADSDRVYWTTGGQIMSVPLAGGTPSTVGAGGDESESSGFAVDGTTLYWWDLNAKAILSESSGGHVATLATGENWAGASVIGFGLGRVYWTAFEPDGISSLLSIPLEGGTVATLAKPGAPGSMARTIAGAYAYGLNGPIESADIVRVALASGEVTTLATHETNPGGFVADAESVYWGFGGRIKCVPSAGGRVVTLVDGPPDAGALTTVIAQDATSLYWLNQGPVSPINPATEGFIAKVSKY